MDKPFEFDIGEKVMLSLIDSGKLWGPFTIVDRRAGGNLSTATRLALWGRDQLLFHPDNKYAVYGEKVAYNGNIAGRLLAGWYLERNLRRTVLNQLVRAVCNRRLSHERKTEIKERKTSKSEAI